MRILVLGGTGYLGSKIVFRMIQEGYDIYCTRRPTSDTWRLGSISDQIKWVSARIEDISVLLSEIQFDAIFNFACNYGRGIVDEIDVIRANAVFPLEVMSIATAKGIKRIYNVGTGLPQYTNIYSLSKNILDDFGRLYSTNRGITYCSFKLEMFYGIDEPSDRFLPSVIKKMIKGETVEVSSGEQHRDIIYIDDVVNALMIILGSELNGFNIIPIGTGTGPSIGELVDYIWKLTGNKSVVKKGAYNARSNEPDCTADINIIKRYCEWNPLEWKEGIEKMVRGIMEEEEVGVDL